MINFMFEVMDINILGENLMHTKHSIRESSDDNANCDIIMHPREAENS